MRQQAGQRQARIGTGEDQPTRALGRGQLGGQTPDAGDMPMGVEARILHAGRDGPAQGQPRTVHETEPQVVQPPAGMDNGELVERLGQKPRQRREQIPDGGQVEKSAPPPPVLEIQPHLGQLQRRCPELLVDPGEFAVHQPEAAVTQEEAQCRRVITRQALQPGDHNGAGGQPSDDQPGADQRHGRDTGGPRPGWRQGPDRSGAAPG